MRLRLRYPARPMALRLLAARLVAALLLLLWTTLALAILIGYRPGGPADLLVGLAGFLPCPLALAALVWPPVDEEQWVDVAALWLGIASVLLLAPLVVGVLQTLAGGGRQTLLPSLEVAYAGVLALGSTAGYAAVGVVRHFTSSRSASLWRTVAGTGLAVVLTLVGTAVFGGVAVANEQALRRDSPERSAWGPTDPGLVPVACDAPVSLGPSAAVTIEAAGRIDRELVGTALIQGVRQGSDEQWQGRLESRFGDSTMSYTRSGDAAWLATDGGVPRERASGFDQLLADADLTLEGPALAVIRAPDSRAVTQSLAVELFDGAQARHCRRQIDGPTALRAMLALDWLVDDRLKADPDDLHAWRGDIDWWVFADGQLGRVLITVSGYPGDAWPASGISATLTATLSATDRDRPHEVLSGTFPRATDAVG